MVRGLLSTGLALLAITGASAGQRAGGPPTQQIVRIDSSGGMQVYYQVTVCMSETRTRTVQARRPVTKEVQEEVNGEIRTRTVTEYVTEEKEVTYTVVKPACETKMRTAKLEQVKAFETDGKLISPKYLDERLAEDTLVVVSPLSREATVLYSADGEAIDSFWLQNLRTTTLVVVGPQLPGSCGAPMMGYGVPPCPPAIIAPAPVAPGAPAPPPPVERN